MGTIELRPHHENTQTHKHTPHNTQHTSHRHTYYTPARSTQHKTHHAHIQHTTHTQHTSYPQQCLWFQLASAPQLYQLVQCLSVMVRPRAGDFAVERPGAKHRRWAFRFKPGVSGTLQRKKACLRQVMKGMPALRMEDVSDTRVDVVWPTAVGIWNALRIACKAAERDDHFVILGMPVGIKWPVNADGKEKKDSREKKDKKDKDSKEKKDKKNKQDEKHTKRTRKKRKKESSKGAPAKKDKKDTHKKRKKKSKKKRQWDSEPSPRSESSSGSPTWQSSSTEVCDEGRHGA